jgi:hypothetical protein
VVVVLSEAKCGLWCGFLYCVVLPLSDGIFAVYLCLIGRLFSMKWFVSIVANLLYANGTVPI